MRLRCIAGPMNTEFLELEDGKSYVFGREPSGSGSTPILLESKSVSRSHCQITVNGGEVTLIDLKSSNGTRLNKKKILTAVLRERDLVQMGEFSFLVEDGEATGKRVTENTKNQKSAQGSETAPKFQAPQFFRQQLEKFEGLDLSKRVLIVLMVVGALAHWLTTAPAISDARRMMLSQSYEIARKSVRTLGERNRRELAEGSSFLLDCKSGQGVGGVVESYLLDARGKAVCPVGGEVPMDELNEMALYRGEQADNCEWRITRHGEQDCELVFPVREFQEKQTQYVTVGVARIRFSPQAALEGVQKLQAQSWRTLFISLLLLLGVWWLWLRWLSKALYTATESLHLVVTGNAQNLEKFETFAAADPMVEEINRLISKSNQAVGPKNEERGAEASFLQLILQQVLLLEERAVMIVDKDNHLIAASASLSSVVPVNIEAMNAHITDAVTESHLQGELMSLLNDLSASSEVIDRALSSSDRIVQVRGMPLFLHDDYAAAILIF